MASGSLPSMVGDGGGVKIGRSISCRNRSSTVSWLGMTASASTVSASATLTMAPSPMRAVGPVVVVRHDDRAGQRHRGDRAAGVGLGLQRGDGDGVGLEVVLGVRRDEQVAARPSRRAPGGDVRACGVVGAVGDDDGAAGGDGARRPTSARARCPSAPRPPWPTCRRRCRRPCRPSAWPGPRCSCRRRSTPRDDRQVAGGPDRPADR